MLALLTMATAGASTLAVTTDLARTWGSTNLLDGINEEHPVAIRAPSYAAHVLVHVANERGGGFFVPADLSFSPRRQGTLFVDGETITPVDWGESDPSKRSIPVHRALSGDIVIARSFGLPMPDVAGGLVVAPWAGVYATVEQLEVRVPLYRYNALSGTDASFAAQDEYELELTTDLYGLSGGVLAEIGGLAAADLRLAHTFLGPVQFVDPNAGTSSLWTTTGREGQDGDLVVNAPRITKLELGLSWIGFAPFVFEARGERNWLRVRGFDPDQFDIDAGAVTITQTGALQANRWRLQGGVGLRFDL